ncbi:hypothetical protein R1flu_000216 [Riccia fluitans]|uniref:Uncharacterized protein n=1 Tax=Riccia fluitans TaxID=41844 RepID=A0ABD1Y050_9MARC
MGSEQPSRKRPRSSPTPRMETKEISLQPWQPRGRERRRLSNPCIFLTWIYIGRGKKNVEISLKANRLEMDPPLSTPTRQTSGRGSNHIPADDTTKEVLPTSSKLPSDGIMEESVSQMTTMLSNILEHHGRANQHLASLEGSRSRKERGGEVEGHD